MLGFLDRNRWTFQPCNGLAITPLCHRDEDRLCNNIVAANVEIFLAEEHVDLRAPARSGVRMAG